MSPAMQYGEPARVHVSLTTNPPGTVVMHGCPKPEVGNNKINPKPLTTVVITKLDGRFGAVTLFS